MANEEYKKYLINSKKIKISTHFTLSDVANSPTAIKKNIDNRPSAEVIKNATLVINKILEPIRVHFNSPITINCIYRSPSLNEAIGGVATSQHVTGQAVDFTVKDKSIEEVYQWIKNNLIYDQLIQEGTWVHVSYSAIKNRKQSLRLVNGKYIKG